jgi:hypothetical protein
VSCAAPQRGGRITVLAFVIALAVTALAALALRPAPAEAGSPTFDFGFADDRNSDNLFTNADASVRNTWLGRVENTGARYARINVYWSSVAPTKPTAPANPNDPAYNWDEVDRAVRSANAQGLDVILLALNAPPWAEPPGRPNAIRAGTWKPNSAEFGTFARALATRYSGSFLPTNGGGLLPKVSFYEAWNEPNLRNYLNPLWKGKKPNAPILYRGLLNAFYAGVKSVSSANQVITGGTSPFGDPPGGRRMHPIQFWRTVFCLNKKLRQDCSAMANFDIFGHNAINSPGDGPSKNASHPEDVTPADMKDLAKVLKAAERAGTTPGQHDFWSTETWYESPPERQALSLKGQAAAMAEAMYILWKAGADNVIWLQIRDSKYDPPIHPLLSFQTGVYFFNGKPKPSVKALQFPFVGDRKKGGSKTTLWGVAPASGTLTVEAKAKGKGGFKQIASEPVNAGRVFKFTDKVKGKKVKLRAKVGSKKSLVWSLR